MPATAPPDALGARERARPALTPGRTMSLPLTLRRA
jgi:hypothetical protein